MGVMEERDAAFWGGVLAVYIFACKSTSGRGVAMPDRFMRSEHYAGGVFSACWRKCEKFACQVFNPERSMSQPYSMAGFFSLTMVLKRLRKFEPWTN